MNIVVLEDFQKAKETVEALLTDKGHTCSTCRSTNEFLQTFETVKPDRMIINVQTWHKGRSIYNYFDIGKKLQQIPISFYNAPDTFHSIRDRTQHPQDKVFRKDVPLEVVVSEL